MGGVWNFAERCIAWLVFRSTVFFRKFRALMVIGIVRRVIVHASSKPPPIHPYMFIHSLTLSPIWPPSLYVLLNLTVTLNEPITLAIFLNNNRFNHTHRYVSHCWELHCGKNNYWSFFVKIKELNGLWLIDKYFEHEASDTHFTLYSL